MLVPKCLAPTKDWSQEYRQQYDHETISLEGRLVSECYKEAIQVQEPGDRDQKEVRCEDRNKTSSYRSPRNHEY